MKILVAEDEQAILMQYQLVLEERGHTVTTCENGEECVNAYKAALRLHNGARKHDDQVYDEVNAEVSTPPFDAVILDYRMPKKDGLAAAIEIYDLCPSQRIVFASAYTADTLMTVLKNLHRIVELMQKPFDLEYFVDAVEDVSLYKQLERLNLRVRDLKDHNLDREQLVALLEGAHRLQKLLLYSY